MANQDANQRRLREQPGLTGAQGPAQSAVRAKRRRLDMLDLSQPDLNPNVRSAVMTLMDELDRMADELAEAQDRVNELENMADEDPLVPVLNRRGFMRELERNLAYAARYGTTGSLIYCDLDGFKRINDAFGHAAGDAALRFVANILVQNVRRSDIVGRLGGDEFALVLHRAAPEHAEAKAKELCDLVAREPMSYKDEAIDLAMSAGVAMFARGDQAADVLERADAAMYASKQSRRAVG